MYSFRLTRLIFNNGTEIHPGNLTVIVGPNNAGKSRILKEIAYHTTGRSLKRFHLVPNLEFTIPENLEELRQAHDVERHQNEDGAWTFNVLSPELDQQSNVGSSPWPRSYEEFYEKGRKRDPKEFVRMHGMALVAFLTTERRLQLVKASDSQAREESQQNLLQVFFSSNLRPEESVRELVKREFVKEIALDHLTAPARLRFRVGDNLANLPTDRAEARKILSESELLDDQGDGIRSFVGIVAAILALKRGVFLIDEPEAFLHPPQAYRIGEFLASKADDTRQIIIATHSADVLRGILAGSKDVSILRIDRVGNTNSFRLLEPGRLKELVKDPLLSSARVLDGLFYSGAIVVEGDADVKFYHAVSEKLGPKSSFYFVNADNKQNVPRITGIYRQMGVRCTGIVDFDVLDDARDFERQLASLELTEREKQGNRNQKCYRQYGKGTDTDRENRVSKKGVK